MRRLRLITAFAMIAVIPTFGAEHDTLRFCRKPGTKGQTVRHSRSQEFELLGD